MKGIPRPAEKQSSITVPCTAEPLTEAIASAEPKKAPTQGVQLMEKIIPNSMYNRMSPYFQDFFVQKFRILSPLS